MGKHTAYWQEYQKAQVRGALRIFLTIASWTLVIVALVLANEALEGAFPLLLGCAFFGLVASVVFQSRHVYAVVCPECATKYKRTKWGGQCPSCGLKLLQHEP